MLPGFPRPCLGRLVLIPGGHRATLRCARPRRRRRGRLLLALALLLVLALLVLVGLVLLRVENQPMVHIQWLMSIRYIRS